MNVQIIQRQITADELIDLRQAVGWGYPDEREAITLGLRNSLFSVCAVNGEEVIGCGRVIGDGGIAVYIQDIIIKPEYQRCGYGMGIMNAIMTYIETNYVKGTMVCLMAAKGKENFYRKFGFIERPNETFGAGMIQYLNK